MIERCRSSRPGQFLLPSALLQAAPSAIVKVLVASRTTDPRNIAFHGVIRLADGITASGTLPQFPALQGMIHGDPFIEDIAFALPSAFFGRHCLKVLENAALKVVHLGKTLLDEV